jgi:hypothetical protein
MGSARRQFMLEDIPNIGKIGDLIALATDIDFAKTSKSLHEFENAVGPEKELLAQLEQVCAIGKMLKLASQGTLQSLVALLMTYQFDNTDAGRS